MKLIKKRWIIILVILGVLIILNPGVKNFKEFKGLDTKEYYGIERTSNFLIFSIYEFNDERYLGVAMNFITIHRKKQVNNNSGDYNNPATDTTGRMSTDTSDNIKSH